MCVRQKKYCGGGGGWRKQASEKRRDKWSRGRLLFPLKQEDKRRWLSKLPPWIKSRGTKHSDTLGACPRRPLSCEPTGGHRASVSKKAQGAQALGSQPDEIPSPGRRKRRLSVLTSPAHAPQVSTAAVRPAAAGACVTSETCTEITGSSMERDRRSLV